MAQIKIKAISGEQLKDLVEKVIFNSKWLLIPFYLKLFYTLARLLYFFVFHGEITNEELMGALHAVDSVMIANLVKMIITGSYNSFVSKNHSEETEKVSSGMLKVKMATSIMGVTSIHLLQTFINVDINHAAVTWEIIYKQVFIHGTIIVGSLILAVIDYLHCLSDSKH